MVLQLTPNPPNSCCSSSSQQPAASAAAEAVPTTATAPLATPTEAWLKTWQRAAKQLLGTVFPRLWPGPASSHQAGLVGRPMVRTFSVWRQPATSRLHFHGNHSLRFVVWQHSS